MLMIMMNDDTPLIDIVEILVHPDEPYHFPIALHLHVQAIRKSPKTKNQRVILLKGAGWVGGRGKRDDQETRERERERNVSMMFAVRCGGFL
jgi:hypothetical protein